MVDKDVKIMKKLLILTLIFCLSLLGCQTPKETLTILVPNGIPSIAISSIEYNNDNYQVDRITGPAPLTAAFTSNTYDIIIAPINLGANLYSKGVEYQLSAVLTWSNLQIISRTPITNLSDLAGKTITAFGEGAIPEIVISYLFNQVNSVETITINYSVSSAQESLLSFLQGDDYAIVSEPVTSQALDSEEDIYVYDLANDWYDFTHLQLFPQAGVFVSTETSRTTKNKALNDIFEAVNLALENPSLIASYCAEMDYPFGEDLISTSIPTSHIDLQYIDESRDAVNQMLQLIYDTNPALIGNALPDEGWWY